MKNHREQRINFDVIRRGIQIFWTTQYEDKSNALTIFQDDEAINPQIHFNVNYSVPITTISHELLHAVRRCLNVIGFKNMEDYDDESLTYFHSYALEQCLKYARKHNIKLCDSVADLDKERE
jgi:hypothetical protein